MNFLLAMPLEVRTAIAAAVGAVLGLLALQAWLRVRSQPRPQGAGLWVPATFVVVLSAAGLAGLYWWEVGEQGLRPPDHVVQAPNGPVVVPLPAIPPGVVHAEFAVHALLLWLMLVASMIDFDEQVIPDIITLPGTLVGLLVAAVFPWAMMPAAKPLAAAPWVGLSFLRLTSPEPWPQALDGFPHAWPLVLGLGCWWLWCIGLLPRTWYSRHGWGRAAALMFARLWRSPATPRILALGAVGSLAIAGVWRWGAARWEGLLTALVGMAAGGSLIWIVRNIGRVVMRREVMGFGDVTLMAMIGAFLGWQSCLPVFFLAPFAGIVMGLGVLVIRRDNVIPYGPFLCLAAGFTLVFWRAVWWGFVEPLLAQLGLLLPLIVLVCLAAMAPLLLIVVWLKVLLRSLFMSPRHKRGGRLKS